MAAKKSTDKGVRARQFWGRQRIKKALLALDQTYAILSFIEQNNFQYIYKKEVSAAKPQLKMLRQLLNTALVSINKGGHDEL